MKFEKWKDWSAGYQSRVFKLSEPIIGYKQPIIASGATPIGSAGRAPDRTIAKNENFSELKVSFEPMIE
jgi:hypothetical protein